MIWRKIVISVGEENLVSQIKDTFKNRRTIESIHILKNRVLDLRNEIDNLDDKLEV